MLRYAKIYCKSLFSRPNQYLKLWYDFLVLKCVFSISILHFALLCVKFCFTASLAGLANFLLVVKETDRDSQ